MSKKLYVGGLPYSVTSAQLEEIFSKIGKVVSCDLITDKYSGQSKGFGFVEMEKDNEADQAIKDLNGTKVGEREITVNEARPREERRPGFDNRRGEPRRDSRGPRRDFR
jgi:RNA recognition motif-containing protein